MILEGLVVKVRSPFPSQKHLFCSFLQVTPSLTIFPKTVAIPTRDGMDSMGFMMGIVAFLVMVLLLHLLAKFPQKERENYTIAFFPFLFSGISRSPRQFEVGSSKLFQNVKRVGHIID